MLLFPLALAAGVVLGVLRGGRFRSLAGLPLRFPAVLVPALVLQGALGALEAQAARVTALLASNVLVGAWLVANLSQGPRWHRRGLACLTVGHALNLAPIVVNGGMPVSMNAFRRVGGSPEVFEQAPNLHKHVAVSDGAALSWLGDVVPLDGLGAVVSVGDIAMIVGVVMVICAGMRRLPVPLDTETGAPSFAAGPVAPG